MKALTDDLMRAIAQERLTLCYCWRITRNDGIVQGFTNFDRDLTIDDVTYEAAVGFSPSASATTNTNQSSNFALTGILNSDAINEEDLKSGLYDNARIYLFMVDWTNLPTELVADNGDFIPLLNGFFGTITQTEQAFSVEIKSLSEALTARKNYVISKTCRWAFCDIHCGLDIEDYTHSVTVASVTSNSIFTLSQSFPDNRFLGGRLTWEDGAANVGSAMILKSEGAKIWLATPAPSLPVVSDPLTVVEGCQKTESDCKRFNNYDNFGGETDMVPGNDRYFSGS